MEKLEDLFIGMGLLLFAVFIFYVFLKGKKSPIYDEDGTDLLPDNYIGLWFSVIGCVIVGIYFLIEFFG
jgi:divalent metal cation (Fe/Co/Zn/Cd) transporter